MSAFKIFSRRRPLGRPIHRWEDSMRMDLKEIGLVVRSLSIIEKLL